LRTLYRQAWPNASAETRDSTLKHRFEHGLTNPELTQYLRIHARDDDFAATVLKAPQFVDAMDSTRPKKTVRFMTDNDGSNTHPTVNTLTSEPDFQPLINGIMAVIDKALSQSSQQAASSNKQNMTGSHMQSKLVHNSDRRNYSSPPPRAGNYDRYSSPGPRQSNDRRFLPGRGQTGQPNQPRSSTPMRQTRPEKRVESWRQDSTIPRAVQRTFSRPPQTQAQQRPPPWNVTNRQRPSDRDFPYRNGTPPANNRRGSGCWICGTYGCHSANHRPQAMAPQYTDRTQPSGNPNGLPRSGQRQPTYTGRSWNQ